MSPITIIATSESKEILGINIRMQESKVIIHLWCNCLEYSRESILTKYKQDGKSSFSHKYAADIFSKFKL